MHCITKACKFGRPRTFHTGKKNKQFFVLDFQATTLADRVEARVIKCACDMQAPRPDVNETNM